MEAGQPLSLIPMLPKSTISVPAFSKPSSTSPCYFHCLRLPLAFPLPHSHHPRPILPDSSRHSRPCRLFRCIMDKEEHQIHTWTTFPSSPHPESTIIKASHGRSGSHASHARLYLTYLPSTTQFTLESHKPRNFSSNNTSAPHHGS